MLKIKNISKKYNNNFALDSISFDLNNGEVLGILGENGAGKTTLINIISSVTKPTQGQIILNDYDYGSKLYKTKIGVAFGGKNFLYDRLTVKENLKYFSKLYGIEDSESIIVKLSEKLQFYDYQNKRIETLSTGMKQRVSIAISILNNPELILLDEPTLGLDISGQNIIKDIVNYLKSMNKMILYSTNIVSEIEEICDNVIIISKGKLVEYDSIKNLKNKHGKNFKETFMKIMERSTNESYN